MSQDNSDPEGRVEVIRVFPLLSAHNLVGLLPPVATITPEPIYKGLLPCQGFLTAPLLPGVSLL